MAHAAAAAAAGVSASAHAYTLLAISANTRKSYAAPQQRYIDWAAASGFDSTPAGLTPERVIDFLSQVADSNQYFAATIRAHRSALSTWFADSLLPGANPCNDPRVSRCMEGISKALRKKDEEKRSARPVTISLTTDLVAKFDELGICGPDAAAEDVMRWAAVTLGAYAGLRPSEFLATYRDRQGALKPEAITFFARADDPHLTRSLPPPGASPQILAVIPDRFRIDLGVTKADQHGKDRFVPVAAKRAVKAMWMWVNLRRALSPNAEEVELFRVPGSLALSQANLTECIASWAALAMGTDLPKVTGRTFRRGMASSLMASGAPTPDAQAIGRWRSSAMPAIYTDAASMEARRAAISRNMH